jgi:hypothetical protein
VAARGGKGEARVSSQGWDLREAKGSVVVVADVGHGLEVTRGACVRKEDDNQGVAWRRSLTHPGNVRMLDQKKLSCFRLLGDFSSSDLFLGQRRKGRGFEKYFKSFILLYTILQTFTK